MHFCVKLEAHKTNGVVAVDIHKKKIQKKYNCQTENIGLSGLIFAKLPYGI